MNQIGTNSYFLTPQNHTARHINHNLNNCKTRYRKRKITQKNLEKKKKSEIEVDNINYQTY